MNSSRLTGSRRKPASITSRALYSARSVRADRPCSPGVCWKTRKVSRMACGSSQVEIVARHLEHAAAVEEARADRPHRRRLGGVDALLDVEHQDLVELRHRLGRPVVAVHQHLGAELLLGGAAAEALRPRRSAGRTPAGPRAGRPPCAAARAPARSVPSCLTSWLASKGVISPLAASSRQVRPRPAARATQITTCRSRRPPGLSLQLGSSAYGVPSYLTWRCFISSVLARRKARGVHGRVAGALEAR